MRSASRRLLRPTRSGRRAALHRLLRQREVNLAQLGQRFSRLAHLPFEEGDLLKAFFCAELQCVRIGAAGLRLDHLAELGEREAKLLALDDQRKADRKST